MITLESLRFHLARDVRVLVDAELLLSAASLHFLPSWQFPVRTDDVKFGLLPLLEQTGTDLGHGRVESILDWRCVDVGGDRLGF